MKNKSRRISIVAHALRAGGGISVGKNLILGLTKRLPHAIYQIFVPHGLDYENSVSNGVDCQWITYKQRTGLFNRWLYDKFELTRKISEFSPDVVLCLGNRGVDSPIDKQIILIQDAHFFYPKKHYAREKLLNQLIIQYKRMHFRRDLTKTSVLLCQTETAVMRLRSVYAYKNDIEIIPNAVSLDSLAGAEQSRHRDEIPAFVLDSKKNEASDSTQRNMVEQNPYRIFYLTRYYPHKNLEIFLDLFDKYHAQLKNVVLYTTIARDQHAGAARFLDEIEARNLGKNIVNIGPLDQKDLAPCFRSMNALVMPSTLESFSGTYIEAMAFGCPIITSDLDFAHEICKDAAIYFDPWSVDALFDAIMKLISDPQLSMKMIEKGHHILSNSSRSWDENSQKLAEIIERQLVTE